MNSAITHEKLIALKDWRGWAGWCCGNLFRPKSPMAASELDEVLRIQAKESGRGAAILSIENALYGWGYVEEGYLDGGYWWPFFIPGDQFKSSGATFNEQRSIVRDTTCKTAA